MDLITPLVTWVNENALKVWSAVYLLIGMGISAVEIDRENRSRKRDGISSIDTEGLAVLVAFILATIVWPSVCIFWILSPLLSRRDRDV